MDPTLAMTRGSGPPRRDLRNRRPVIGSSEPPDPYRVLNLARTASPAELVHAYRSQLRRHHPDTRPPSTPDEALTHDQELRRAIAAYALLRDPVRRADYDRRHQPAAPIMTAATGHSAPTVVVLGDFASISPQPEWIAPLEPRPAALSAWTVSIF
jgi:DnaJ-class molecular chaperone